MGSDVGIFWHGLQHGLGDGMGRGYGSVVGRGELGRGKVGHRLIAKVSGF